MVVTMHDAAIRAAWQRQIPLRRYGHNFLDTKTVVQINFDEGKEQPLIFFQDGKYPAARLTTNPATTTRTPEKPADRRVPHAPAANSSSPQYDHERISAAPRAAVDPGLGRSR